MVWKSPVDREALHTFNLIGYEPTHPTFRIPYIVPRPVGASVARRLRVDAMSKGLYEGSPLRISKDCLKEGGRFLPIRCTLRRIPVAALGLKKYLSGTVPVSMHGNNVDAATLLGDSKVFAVKHTPCDTIPEFVQRLEYDGEISSSVAREKAVHVFEDNGSWRASSNEPHKLMKQSRLAPSKPRPWPHSCKREVLAGKPCCPNVSFRDICVIEFPYVIAQWQVRPVLAQDFPAERLDLAMETKREPRPLQTEVKPSDTGEE